MWQFAPSREDWGGRVESSGGDRGAKQINQFMTNEIVLGGVQGWRSQWGARRRGARWHAIEQPGRGSRVESKASHGVADLMVCSLGMTNGDAATTEGDRWTDAPTCRWWSWRPWWSCEWTEKSSGQRLSRWDQGWRQSRGDNGARGTREPGEAIWPREGGVKVKTRDPLWWMELVAWRHWADPHSLWEIRRGWRTPAEAGPRRWQREAGWEFWRYREL